MERKCANCQGPLTKSYQKKYCSTTCHHEDAREIRHPNLIENYFDSINTKDKAYWLGFIFADGRIKKSQTTLTVKLCRKERPYG